MSPDAMRIRLETAQLGAQTMLQIGQFNKTPIELAHIIFGAGMADSSATAISGSGDRQNALTMMFMIPEFQRR
jgi:uncharacterized protein (DUF1800 family)